MNFVAVDVETANADMASICQIGIARYEGGNLTEEWKSYIDPEDYFDSINTSIHGINEETVRGAPKFREIISQIRTMMDNRIAVCHTHFDRVSISQASTLSCVLPPTCTWLDSARVARRSWEEFAWSGYGLQNVCKKIGFEFKHHDALEDAKAAAQIILSAINHTGIELSAWLDRVTKPIHPDSQTAIQCDGNPDGFLYGNVLVFTGSLEIQRVNAAKMAAQIGCAVAPGVTKKTTILVVGDQDITKLAGHNKSSKHRKAEELIAKGYSIRILKESDFKELVAQSK